ncbi:ATP dependent DNA ligase [Agrocybe pediades]|nr:ATP dependent DNA ligase [Agrocybe pediades]
MEPTLQNYRGALALVGKDIDALATAALSSQETGAFKHTSNPYHITVVTKDELRRLTPEKREKLESFELDTRHIFPAGVGRDEGAGVYWVVIIWAAGQLIRKRIGLPLKHFHITLSYADVHDIDKGIRSIFSGEPLASSNIDLLDHATFTLFSFGQYAEAREYAVALIVLDSHSHKGFLRLGDTCLGTELPKIAMLSYANAYEKSADERVKSYCMKKLVECSKETEWGLVFQEFEIQQLDDFSAISSYLLEPWSSRLQEDISEQKLSPSLMLESRHSLYIPSRRGFYKLPRWFRWIIPYHLAVMSTPRNDEDINALASPPIGIRHVLTLTEETPLSESWFQGKQISNTFLPVPNYFPPSIEQMDLIMRLFDDDKKLPILVHCGGGKGRAGTVIACYLAAYGFRKPQYEQDHPELSGPEAIASLRTLRPGSLETAQQEAFVSKWCSVIWKRQSVYPDLPSEPLPTPLEIEGAPMEKGDLFVMVGLPGSGKSWFSSALLARNRSGWIHISQDETGSRSACETEIGRRRDGKRIILDRCNTSSGDRKSWLDLASIWSTSPVCIWFDYDRELCTSRAQMRAGHPTLPPGSRVRNAVDQMSKIFSRPTFQEGFKTIVTIRSFSAAEEAIRRLSPKADILKFPRTPHLINLGAATADDVHTDVSAFASAGGHVVITEKIDGANMGFSLSSDRAKILVQNRSHYVNSAMHEQFKKLGLWVERHEEELRSILDRDPYFPERFILYGEWVYATHSIPYTELPDYFIAYDLFDRSTGTWTCTSTLHALLANTTVATVPIIHEGDMPAESEILRMIQQTSKYYEGRVEGVYVKVEANGCVKLRGKVVRSDFIAGNEHWTRGGIRVNELA